MQTIQTKKYKSLITTKASSNNMPLYKLTSSGATAECAEYKTLDGVCDIGVWLSYNGGANRTVGWLAIEFITPKRIEKYSLSKDSAINTGPKNWTFEAFDEVNSRWIVLNTQINQVVGVNTSLSPYEFSNSNSYKKYRINITANSGGTYLGIREMDFFDVEGNLFLLKQNLEYYSIKSEYYNSVTKKFNPVPLSGGLTPNKVDIETLGFDDLNILLSTMTVGTDTFKPIDIFDGNFEIKLYKR